MVRALSCEAEPCCPAVPWANGTQINMIRSLDPPAERRRDVSGSTLHGTQHGSRTGFLAASDALGSASSGRCLYDVMYCKEVV
jgi:hypothetical protein